MKRKNFETPMQQGQVTYERKGITSEVVIPLLSCILFGLGVTIALAVAQWGFLNIGPKAAWRFAGSAGVLLSSLALTWRFYRAITWIAEEATRRDLDRDGWIGEPPEPRIITIRGGQTPAIEDKRERLRQELEEFVKGCQVDTSMRRWEPRLGRDKYLMFRQILLEAGHAAWTSNADKRAGWELTAPAEDIIATFD